MDYRRFVILGSETIMGHALTAALKDQDREVLGLETRELVLDSDLYKKIASMRADCVLNACLKNYGLNKHIESPADLFQDVQSLEGTFLPVAFRAGVKKYINLIPNCVYPAFIDPPFYEKDIWSGQPDLSVFAYAQAKKNLMVQANAFRRQYKYNAINLILTAFYGPYDSFDPENAQVIPSMIVKMERAKDEKQKKLILWGTGKATREFIFVENAAHLVIQACMRYNAEEWLNICTGQEIPVAELAETIKELVGFGGTIEWDPQKPEGIKRKCLSPSLFIDKMGPFPLTSLRDGLQKTIRWYHDNYKRAVAPGMR